MAKKQNKDRRITIRLDMETLKCLKKIEDSLPKNMGRRGTSLAVRMAIVSYAAEVNY